MQHLRQLCGLGQEGTRCECVCGCDRTNDVEWVGPPLGLACCGNCRANWHRPVSCGGQLPSPLTEQEWRDFCRGAGIDPDG